MQATVRGRRGSLVALSSAILASLLMAACGSGQPDETTAAGLAGSGAVSDTTAPPGVPPQGGPDDPKSAPAPGEHEAPHASAAAPEALAEARAQVAGEEFSALCTAPDGTITIRMWNPVRDASGAPRTSSEDVAESFETQGAPGTTCETSEAVAAELAAEEGAG
jgi:hypothetical protein